MGKSTRVFIAGGKRMRHWAVVGPAYIDVAAAQSLRVDAENEGLGTGTCQGDKAQLLKGYVRRPA